MSTAPRYIPHYTVADYQHWDGDWELWQGIAVAMAPSPFGPHQNYSLRIARAFLDAIEEAKCQAVVLQEVDWIISNDTVVRPDVLVLCGDVPEGHVTQTPVLIVEILSPATADRDRNEKRVLYQDHGVDYYLILDPSDRTFEAYRRDDQGNYQPFDLKSGYEFCFCDDCHIHWDPAAIF